MGHPGLRDALSHVFVGLLLGLEEAQEERVEPKGDTEDRQQHGEDQGRYPRSGGVECTPPCKAAVDQETETKAPRMVPARNPFLAAAPDETHWETRLARPSRWRLVPVVAADPSTTTCRPQRTAIARRALLTTSVRPPV